MSFQRRLESSYHINSPYKAFNIDIASIFEPLDSSLRWNDIDKVINKMLPQFKRKMNHPIKYYDYLYKVLTQGAKFRTSPLYPGYVLLAYQVVA
jgi:hypothetical protein